MGWLIISIFILGLAIGWKFGYTLGYEKGIEVTTKKFVKHVKRVANGGQD